MISAVRAKSHLLDLNQRPELYESSALPTELRWQPAEVGPWRSDASSSGHGWRARPVGPLEQDRLLKPGRERPTPNAPRKNRPRREPEPAESASDADRLNGRPVGPITGRGRSGRAGRGSRRSSPCRRGRGCRSHRRCRRCSRACRRGRGRQGRAGRGSRRS